MSKKNKPQKADHTADKVTVKNVADDIEELGQSISHNIKKQALGPNTKR